MRLTKFSDYAFRVLLIAANRPEERTTIEETAELYGISAAHLKKVVLLLSRTGYLEGLRGRAGGFRLAKPAEEINLGAVLRLTEPDFGMVECFLPENACPITRVCALPKVINTALQAFVTTFDQYTLADIQLNDAHHFARRSASRQPLRGPQLQAGPLRRDDG